MDQNKVPLVMLKSDGTQEVIGQAVIGPDGETVQAVVDKPEVFRSLFGDSDGPAAFSIRPERKKTCNIVFKNGDEIQFEYTTYKGYPDRRWVFYDENANQVGAYDSSYFQFVDIDVYKEI